MAEEPRDAEVEYVRELRRKTADLRRRANVESAEQEHFSALVGLNAEVIKQKKILSELTKQQRITAQQFSLVNSVLATSRGEIAKSIANYRMNNVRMAQSIQIKQQELAVTQEQIKVTRSEIQANKERVSYLRSLKERQMQVYVALGQELITSEENKRALASQVQARQEVVNALRTEMDTTSTLKQASEARLQTLSDANQSLRDELTASQSLLIQLNRRAATGEELTNEENARRSELNSEIARLIPLVNASNATLADERSVRDDLIATLAVQQRELDSTSSQLSVLTDQLTDATSATNRLEETLNKASTKLNGLSEEISNLEKTTVTAEKNLDEFSKEAANQANELKLLKINKLANKLSRLADIMNAVAKPINDMVKSVRDTQQRLGVVASQAATIGLKNLQVSAKTFAGALAGGGPGVTAEQIAQSQADFREEFGGIITSEAAADLAQQAVSMGVTTKQLAQARRAFMAQTGNDGIRAAGQVDKFITEFKKKGLTAQDAMEAIQKNSELLARNGTRFATALTRAAADAKKIGVDLGKVDQIADSIIGDFEGYLEKQAELGAMGFGLDSSKLAELAESGDTAAFGNELRSQLAATGKDLNKLRRSERQALEGAFGIPISDILKLAGPTPEGGGEPTEKVQIETKDMVSKGVDATDAVGKTLSVISSTLTYANGILGLIAANTAVSAAKSGLGGTPSTAAPSGTPSTTASLSRGAKALSGAKVGAGMGVVTGLVSGFTEYQESGNIKKAFGRGLATLAGSIIGGALGSFIPIPGVGTMLGATAGSWAANWLVDKVFADDVVSKPGYGKRTLLTPSGAIALNDKDNIIAYADDMVGTKRLPFGSIVKNVADYGSKYGPLLLSLFERGKEFGARQGGTNSLIHLGKLIGERLPEGKRSLERAAFNPRSVKTLLGETGKVDTIRNRLLKFTALNSKAVPVIGSLLGGGLTGYDEYKKSGSLLRGVGKGLFSAAGGTLGSIGAGVATLGNPIVASAGGIAGSLGAEMAFDSMMGTADDYISYADDLMGGTKLPLGTLSKAFSMYKQGGVGGLKSNLMSTGLGLANSKIPGFSRFMPQAQDLYGTYKQGGTNAVKGSLLNTGVGMLGKKVPGIGTGMNIFSAYKKDGLKGAMGSLVQGGMGKGIGAAIGTAIPIPFVGTALGSLVGSKIGKLAGGLFGKKKQQTATISPEMMQAGTVPDLSTFLGSQARREETKQSPQQPITVDTTGIEQKLNNFINALQNIQINMDGNKVGKVLVNSGDAAMSTGVFRAQSR